jgi:YegS/Rv2252/BmrU family lipid kinase
MEQPRFRQVQIIANPAAGGDAPFPAIFNSVFRKHGVRWDMRLTHAFGDGARLAREAIADGADCVVAYGGDGTVMDVAGGLLDSGVPMGIVPGGTGNAVAGAIGMPPTIEAAAELIAGGGWAVHAFDAAEANGKPFVLRADVGLLADTLMVDREAKDQFGSLAYAAALLRGIVTPRETKYTIEIDGERMVINAAGCMIVNFDNIGTIHRSIAHGVRADDGLLDLLIFRNDAISLVQTVASLLDLADYTALFGRYRGEVIRVETPVTQNWILDGDTESIGVTPVTFRTRHGALRLVVPSAPFQQDDGVPLIGTAPPAP